MTVSSAPRPQRRRATGTVMSSCHAMSRRMLMR